MLKQLILRNFRQHRELTINFQPGVNAIVGANEAGKSSVVEALGYAWYGSAYLTEPIADVIRWGCQANDMQVELYQEINGVTYHTKRGPSGAEMRWPGQYVVGQDAVTAYNAELLNVKPKVASKLLFAAQGDLRGALTGGATKAVELIDRIADLSIVDDLTTLVSRRNPSGSTARHSAALTELQCSLEALQPPAVDVTALAAEVAAAKAAVEPIEREASRVSAELQRVEAGLTAAQRQLAEASRLGGERESLIQQSGAASARLAVARAAADALVRPFEGDDHAIEQQLEARGVAAAGRATLIGVQAQVIAWNAEYARLPATEFLAGEELLSWYEKALKDHKLLSAEWDKQRADVAAWKAQLITAENCNLCGRNLSTVEEVLNTNARLSAQIAQNESTIPGLADKLKLLGSQLETLRMLDRLWSGMSGAAICQHPQVEKAPAPHGMWKLRCNAEIPPEDTTLKADCATWGAYKVAVHRADASVKAAAQQVADLDRKLAATSVPDTQQIEARIQQLSLERTKWQLQVDENTRSRMDASYRVQTAEREASSGALMIRNYSEKYSKLSASIIEQQKLVKQMETANELLSILKTAKQVLANRIWDSILLAVTSYLASVRGIEAAVTREDDRFRVGGKPAASLSGSAKDALGLAIRLALMQVFVPNTRVVVLDEPGQGCDAMREPAMLALAKRAGFSQVVLVTHNRDVQELADNLVML
jgi:DNA repair exonuclease SbcCD ATPase subunit